MLLEKQLMKDWSDIFHTFTWDPGFVFGCSVPTRYLSHSVGHDAVGQLVTCHPAPPSAVF